MPLPSEMLKEVRLLEINTRKLVNTLFAGEYHAAFKGQGMTFAEFREYVHGDDIRNIAWPLMARTGKLFIKRYDEERELIVILAVDVSGSGDFGTTSRLKREVISRLAAILGLSAAHNKDHVGLLLFSDQIEHFVPPRKGRAQVMRLLSDVLFFQPKSRKTSLVTGLEYLMGVLKKKSAIFLFSDFMSPQLDQVERALTQLNRRHDVVSVRVLDPGELSLPKMGLVHLRDAETGEVLTVDAADPVVRRDYERSMKQMLHQQMRILRRAKSDVIEINTQEDITRPLVQYFQRRIR